MSNIMKCSCGARYRKNWPFGRNSKPRKTFYIKHDEKCGYIKDTIWVNDITTLRDQLIFNFGLKDDTLGNNNE